MSFEEWIKLYETKTHEKFKQDARFQLFFRPDKGFCEVGQLKDMLIINQLCGDARFWKAKIEELARQMDGVTMCGTWCIRKAIKAYIRLFGYELIAENKLPDGGIQFFTKHKTTKKSGRVSPAFKYKDTGVQAYFITWEP